MSVLTIRSGKGPRHRLGLRFALTPLLCCVVLSMAAGCPRNHSWTPAAVDLERLHQAWGEGLPEPLELLGHRQSPEGSETWIVFSPRELLPPSSVQVRHSECPTAVVTGLFRSQEISQAAIGTFNEKKGVMFEWDTPSASFRVRTVSSTKGWASCIEQFFVKK